MKNQRYLAQHDARHLNNLAEQLLRLDGMETDAAEQLLEIVASATTLPAVTQRKDCVAMHSTVTYAQSATDTPHTITLVYPRDADPNAARISVLTPIGLALLGRKHASMADVSLPSGRIDRIRILAIVQPEPTHEEAP